jgi:hypothetical protein
MHAVVNHLHFAAPVGADIIKRVQTEVGPLMGTFEGFKGFRVIQVAEDHLVLVITATSQEVLDRLATEVGGPWLVANIAPLLSRPPERLIGPVVVNIGIPASN